MGANLGWSFVCFTFLGSLYIFPVGSLFYPSLIFILARCGFGKRLSHLDLPMVDRAMNSLLYLTFFNLTCDTALPELKPLINAIPALSFPVTSGSAQ